MTATSYSITLDTSDMDYNAWTVGALAPNAGDIEIRVSLTNTPTRHQVDNAIKAFRRLLSSPIGNAVVLNI